MVSSFAAWARSATEPRPRRAAGLDIRSTFPLTFLLVRSAPGAVPTRGASRWQRRWATRLRLAGHIVSSMKRGPPLKRSRPVG